MVAFANTKPGMNDMRDFASATRREVLAAGAAMAAVLGAPPARGASDALATAIRAFTGAAEPRPGRVRLDVPPLVENGNSVALTVTVDGADAVRAIAIFNEKNPQPDVAVFRLGPRAGRASVSTRIRLATSQRVVAIAELSDGTFWSDSAEVVVTLAACVEE